MNINYLRIFFGKNLGSWEELGDGFWRTSGVIQSREKYLNHRDHREHREKKNLCVLCDLCGDKKTRTTCVTQYRSFLNGVDPLKSSPNSSHEPFLLDDLFLVDLTKMQSSLEKALCEIRAKKMIRDRTEITFTVLEGKIDSSLDDFS